MIDDDGVRFSGCDNTWLCGTLGKVKDLCATLRGKRTLFLTLITVNGPVIFYDII